MVLFGAEDIFDGPLRPVNLFSSGLTGLGHGTTPPYLDEDAVQRRLYWNQAMRDRSPSPSRRLRRAIDEQMVLRSGGTKEDLPDRCEILAVLDEDMLI
ncbi:MAG: hypothetical protein CL912_33810 [Deltaproteobacteria bacterium]|nr:hypothetical protein [Deltaproteobacteria bacterium]